MADNRQTTKRIQVNKAKTTLLMTVAGASVVTVFALMAARTYLSESNYLNRVAGAKETALKQLKSNKDTVDELTSSYEKFSAAAPNALGGDPNGNGEKDGDNGRLVLDALPSKYDFPALTASIEKLLTGYAINSVDGSDDILNQGLPGVSELVEIPFSLEASSSYEGMQTLMQTFERSIRPFQVTILDLTGANGTLKADIDVKTFFMPEKTLDNKTKVVK